MLIWQEQTTKAANIIVKKKNKSKTHTCIEATTTNLTNNKNKSVHT